LCFLEKFGTLLMAQHGHVVMVAVALLEGETLDLAAWMIGVDFWQVRIVQIER